MKNGLCLTWQAAWYEDWPMQKLADKFYEGIDFFIEKRFITNEYIKRAFPLVFLRDNAILVDDKYSLINPSQYDAKTCYAIMLGKTESKVRLNNRNIATCYLCDDSRSEFTIRHNASLLIHLFDNAVANVKILDEAKVTVLIHSETATFTFSGSDDAVTMKKDLNYLKK